MEKCYVTPGERVLVEAPYSEACMHMRVAGTLMLAELLPPSEDGFVRMAQLYRTDGTPFSSPVTYGEAGFYCETDKGRPRGGPVIASAYRFYYYPPKVTTPA